MKLPEKWVDKNNREVKPVEWVWEAFYDDGSVLKQYDDNGLFHNLSEINQNKLTLFRIRKFNEEKHYDLVFEKGMRLIHFYRNYLLKDNSIHIRTTVFGYEKDNNKLLITILPNDDIIISINDISLNFK